MLSSDDVVQTVNIAESGSPFKQVDGKFESKGEFIQDEQVNAAESKEVSAQDEKKEEALKKVNFLELFRFADKWDRLLLVAAVIASCAHGTLMGMFSIIFGDALDGFSPTESTSGLLDRMRPTILNFVYLAIVSLFVSYIQVAFFNLAASRQAARMRKLYFKIILGQDMAWYDSINSGELTTRVAGDVVKIEAGIGDKVGSFLQFMSMCLSGFIIGFVKGWKLTLVILAVTPLLALSGAFLGKLMAEAATEGQAAYAKAGGIAEEVLGLIRIVVAFGGQRREVDRYADALQDARDVNSRRGWFQGLGMGLTMGILIATYALGFWFGNRQVQSGDMTAGAVVTVFFAVIFAAFALGQAAANLPAFAEAQGTAHGLFQILDRRTVIDSLDEEGDTPEEISGKIEFDSVDFTYAGRPDQLILNNMCFTVQPGSTLALVGKSGCGKSTCIQLLERFYNPINGNIRVDGIDIRDINVQWLRSQIGIVSQMPTLFARTIAENIAAGSGLEVNSEYDPRLKDPLQLANRRFRKRDISHEEIIEAAKKANAHDFIMRLPQGYDTMIGERGAQLSGGQKQRIAIARALVRNPKIMLLDEATSALDSQSERIVQEALEKAAEGRATIVIAHRLSTIKNADAIGVVENGRIVELGTHQELMNMNARYAEFVRLQELDHSFEEEEETPDSLDPIASHERHQSIKATSVVSRYSTRSDSKTDGVVSSRDHMHDAHDVDVDQDVVSIAKSRPWWMFWRRLNKKPSLDVEGKVMEGKNAIDQGVTKRAMLYNVPEWPLVLLGCSGQIVMGCLWPVFSILFADIIAVMLENDADKVRFWVIMFVVLAAIAFVFQWMAITPFNLSGERLTYKLRRECFEAILRQEIGWFDDRQNAVGVLTARLSTEANKVRNLTGERVGSLINMLTTIVAGLIIAFVACPKLAATMLVLIPFVAVGGAIQLKVMAGFQGEGLKMFENAGRVASEAVDSVRTVVSINISHDFMDRYAEEIDRPFLSSVKVSQIAGLAFGVSEAMSFVMWAVAFAYGSVLVENGECTFADMMKAISAIAFGAMMLGQIAALLPDAAAGQIAATNIFRTIDHIPSIDYLDESGIVPEKIRGELHFKKVHFEYPIRKEVPVLKGFSIGINQGQTLALVGPSGNGKSTGIALAERFYDPSSGIVTIDGMDIRKCNINWLRDQIGLVNQEPDLFKDSVANNIAYGARKFFDVVPITQEMIEAAARKANAHDFIMALPDGYDTSVGERGSQLSGGQRQRIAIARALLRDPKILLLDEATSALDSNSEQVVQAALDAAAEGRTTIAIAHRLATIQNATVIAVVSDGIVAEKGNHNTLMSKGGLYAEMVSAQSHSNI